ncbi:Alpha carbonic anhydrase 7 [Linum grandiflorum]
MSKLQSTTLSLALIFLLSTIHFASAQTEVDDEREFDYMGDGEKGPSRWGVIHPEWHSCSNGTMQSPIDMLSDRVDVVSHLGRLNRSYKAANATLKNRGHDMMLKWEGGAGSFHMNGTEYTLHQCHWHSPSEHTINGDKFAMEAHMVHESEDGKIAVVGILYKIGRPDSFLKSISDHFEEVHGVEEEVSMVGVVDPRDIRISSREYYRYIGSLTVPPCTENVTWTIVTKVQTVSRLQLKLLRVAVHDDADTNARPLQPRFGRKVELSRPDENDNGDDPIDD